MPVWKITYNLHSGSATTRDYNRFSFVLLERWITVIGNEMNTWTSIFANIWFQIKQIWLIFFTHLKLWVVVKMKWWSFTPPLCIYRITGQEKPPENCEMNEMTMPFRHRIRNSNPDGLRLSPLPIGYGGSPILSFYEWAGKKHFVSLKLEYQSGVRTRDLRLS